MSEKKAKKSDMLKCYIAMMEDVMQILTYMYNHEVDSELNEELGSVPSAPASVEY